MEFVEYIKLLCVDNVYFKCRGLVYLEGILCVIGYYLIFFFRIEYKDEFIVSYLLIIIVSKLFLYELIELFEKIIKYLELNL